MPPMLPLRRRPIARKAGLHELVQIGDLGVEVQGNGFATSRAYIASNRDVVKSALKGFVEAIHFVYANKKESQGGFRKIHAHERPNSARRVLQWLY
jgi:ABC-type nitrate/sulfonate/bicarbonate transport system substrate-binding protein